MKKKTTIDYEAHVQNALRRVVYDVLQLAEKDGLPGTHHFYISFTTDYPGVDIPEYLREEYPDEITIVLQYEYWDLEVTDDYFSVTLCFNDINERLTIPYHAIISFVDPSVKFGLQFTPLEVEDVVRAMPEESRKGKKNTKTATSEEVTLTNSDGSNIVTLDAFRKK